MSRLKNLYRVKKSFKYIKELREDLPESSKLSTYNAILLVVETQLKYFLEENEDKKGMMELKPCPFCGGKAVISYYQSGFNDRQCYVVCKECKCSTYICCKSKEEAIKAWNTRAKEGIC